VDQAGLTVGKKGDFDSVKLYHMVGPLKKYEEHVLTKLGEKNYSLTDSLGDGEDRARKNEKKKIRKISIVVSLRIIRQPFTIELWEATLLPKRAGKGRGGRAEERGLMKR